MKRPVRTVGMIRPRFATLAATWLLLLLLALVWSEPPRAAVRVRVRNAAGQPLAARILCRGLDGAAAGQAWTARTRTGDRLLLVQPGRLALEASSAGARGRAVEVTLAEGEVRRVDLTVGNWSKRGSWLHVFMPERVYTPGETPSLGVQGEAIAGIEEVAVCLYRLDLPRLLTERGSRLWLTTWSGEPSDRELRELAPYLSEVNRAVSPLARREGDSFFDRYVNLPAATSGSYLVRVEAGERATWLAFQVTGLGLVAKCDQERLLVYACDLRTGEPRPGIRLEVWADDQEQPLAQAESAADGLARFALPPDEDLALLVMGSAGADAAALSAERYDRGDDDRVIHLDTDRPVYRPGQRVYLRGLVRDLDHGAYRVPTPEPVTVQVRDPRSDDLVTLELRSNDYGSFAGDFELPAAAGPGDYEVEVEVGGSTAWLTVPAQAYQRPEYRVKVTGPPDLLPRDAALEFEVAADYYFGSPVAGGRVEYSLRREPSWWPSAGDGEEPWETALYREFETREGGAERSSGREVLRGDGRLDAQGRLHLTLPAGSLLPPAAPVRGADGQGRPLVPDATTPYRFVLEATVRDDSGRRETATAAGTVAPTDQRLELPASEAWLKFREPAAVRVTRRDLAGRPVPGGTVTLDSYLRRWTVVKGQWAEVIDRGPTAVVPLSAQGAGQARLALPYAGTWTLVAHSTDAAGQPVVETTWATMLDPHDDLPFWAGPAEAALSAERRRYDAGQTARLRFGGDLADGHVLLTHEGLLLSDEQVRPVRQRQATAEFALGERDLPRATFAAAAVRNKQLHEAQAEVGVRLDSKRLQVKVTSSAAVAGPRQTVTLGVTTTREGQPVDAEVALAVVDESLYAIREDRPEQVIRDFYGGWWNRVNTWFSAQAVYYTGGKEQPGDVRRDFPETALWVPQLRTGPDGVELVSLPLPDNLTTWRITAVAISRATEVGWATTRLVARKPLLVRLETPRFLTQRDTATLRAVVHNDSERAQDVRVTLDLSGATVVDPLRRSLRLAAGQRKVLDWAVSVADAAPLRVRVNATAGALRDAVERVLEVRAYARPWRHVEHGDLAGAAAHTISLAVPATTAPGQASLEVRLSPSVAGHLASAARSLVDYPYGCTEQTTSRLLGCLAARRAWQRLGWPKEGYRRAEVDAMVRDGLLRLRRLQSYDDGWGWWENLAEDPFMTAYAVHGLLTAREAGYRPGEALDDGLDRLESWLQQPPGPQDDPADYALMAWCLARAGRPVPETAWPRLLDQRSGPAARAMLALVTAGQRERQQRPETLARLEAATAADRLAACSVEELAWLVRAWLRVEGATPRVRTLLEQLDRRHDGEGWQTTRATAAAVEALADYLALAELSPTNGTITVALDGRTCGQARFQPAEAGPDEAVVRIPAEALTVGRHAVTLQLSGTGTPRYTVVLDAPQVAEALPAQPGPGLAVTREYRRLVPRPGGGFYRLPLTGGRCRVDDLLEVTLRLQSTGHDAYFVMEDPLPAGCEVLERGEVRDAAGDWADELCWYQEQVVRDDRVAFFRADRFAGPGRTITYLLRAALPGEYQVLPARCEPMYQPERGAATAADRLEIR